MSVQSAQLQPPSFTKAEKESAPEAAVYNIRMTLTSEKKAELTALAKRFEAAAAERGVRKGGIRPLPTQKLTITTRKTPNGEGSKTWATYTKKIHKRTLDMWCSTAMAKQITATPITPGILVEVTMAA